MYSEAFVAYFLVNVVLGFVLHISFRHSSLTRPKRLELVVYALTFLVAGAPILVATLLYATAKSLLHRQPLQHS